MPVGQEDRAGTTVLANRTDASGTMRVALAKLSGPQLAVLDRPEWGVWVAALPDFPGRFANLHCHYDRYNADNLEVVRSFADEAELVCVLWLVGAPTSAPPPVPAPEQSPPEPAPAAPEGSAAAVDGAAGPDERATRGRAGRSIPTAGRRPGPGGGSPVASLDPAGPAAPVPEQALPALTGSFAVRVEVGGVTRGINAGRPVGSESSWKAPLRVRYGCGEVSRTVDIVPPQPPGHTVLLDPIDLPGTANCELVTVNDGSHLPGPGADPRA